MNLYEELSKHYADCAARRDKAKEDRETVFKRIQENLGKELGCGYDPRVKVEGDPDGVCTANVGFIFSKTAKVAVNFEIEKVEDGFAVTIDRIHHDVSTEAGWSTLWPAFYQALRHEVDESFREESKKKESTDPSREKEDGMNADHGRPASPGPQHGRDAKPEAPKAAPAPARQGASS